MEIKWFCIYAWYPHQESHYLWRCDENCAFCSTSSLKVPTPFRQQSTSNNNYFSTSFKQFLSRVQLRMTEPGSPNLTQGKWPYAYKRIEHPKGDERYDYYQRNHQDFVCIRVLIKAADSFLYFQVKFLVLASFCFANSGKLQEHFLSLFRV